MAEPKETPRADRDIGDQEKSDMLKAFVQAEARIERALVHLEQIGPPENTCAGDPVCAESEWPPDKWCDSCLANAARAALRGDA